MKSRKRSKVYAVILALTLVCVPLISASAAPAQPIRATADGVPVAVSTEGDGITLDITHLPNVQEAVLEINTSAYPGERNVYIKTVFGSLAIGPELYRELREADPIRSDPARVRITLSKTEEGLRFAVNVYEKDIEAFRHTAHLSIPYTASAGNAGDAVVAVQTDIGAIVARSLYSKGSVNVKAARPGSYTARAIPTDGRGSFFDIKGKWMENAVSFLYTRAVAYGRPNGLFDPEAVITRAEFVGMLMRIIDAKTEGDYGFTDVLPDKWYYEAAARARALGIAAGTGDGRLDPSKPVTRQEMFAMVYKALECMDIMPDFMTMQFIMYDDWDEVSAYAREPIQTLSKLEIVSGVGDGSRIAPRAVSTRAQAAQLLQALLRFDLLQFD